MDGWMAEERELRSEGEEMASLLQVVAGGERENYSGALALGRGTRGRLAGGAGSVGWATIELVQAKSVWSCVASLSQLATRHPADGGKRSEMCFNQSSLAQLALRGTRRRLKG
jgi:hypothetical protein